MSELLWEIGCEEIPARMLPEAIATLREGLVAALHSVHLTFAKVESHGTPRRLTVFVTDLADQQPDSEETRRGPAWNSAFGPDGQPAKAALGFAASCGVTMADLTKLETPKGSYLSCLIRKQGAPATELLPRIMLELLKGFPWPKSMRWGDGEIRFVRPVHTMVALVNGRLLPCEWRDDSGTIIPAGNLVAGHRFMAPGTFPVTGIADYLAKLRAAKVMLSLAERQEFIREGVNRLAQTVGGEPVLDPGLLAETSCLVEWPVVLAGSFDPIYLAIPPEVLITSMKVHQKYFPIRQADGTLLPKFAVIANLEAPDPNVLIQGYQRVLRARLEDAAFYWTEDRKSSLASRMAGLKEVVYQAKLGTLYHKSLRTCALAGRIARQIAPGAVIDAERAASLAKCDLITGMVGEFPELQGIMGGYYARASGETGAVAQAIREHYQPQGAADTLPITPAGVCLALADKLDTLVGCFAIGLEPTGTKDPFALRRAALGMIRILLDGDGLHLPLLPLLLEGHAAYADQKLERSATETATRLLDFFYGRLSAYLKADGLDYDLIDAVRVLDSDDLLDAVARVRALEQFKQIPAYEALVTANKRIANILAKSGGAAKGENSPEIVAGPVDPELLQAEAEKHLYTELTACSNQVVGLVASAAYAQALTVLAGLREPIDRFFDQVLVNDPDPSLQTNRKRLLAQVRQLFGRIADVSRLVLQE